MITKRIVVNVIVFLVVSCGLIAFGVYDLLMETGDGDRINAEFTDASGLAERNDVTMRGVTVGSVESVALTEEGVRAKLALDPGIEVPDGTRADIVRRSPIGDLVVELTPGDGPAMDSGDTIPKERTSPPPDAGRTVEALADLLHAIPAEDISTVVSELADAVRGRGDDLARLSEVTASLPERILEVRTELRALIETGPEVTGVFADNADDLAGAVTRTAQLADILRDRRFDLVRLYRNGARFTAVAGDLLNDEKANLSCLIADSGRVNSVLAETKHLEDLVGVLELNHYFFDAVELAVQEGLDGRSWFRVQVLPHTEPPARQYEEQLGAPDVFGGDACRSRYGPGVGPGSQDDPPKLTDGSKLHRGR